ncbi:MAG: hypothetical protein JXB00_13370 [Bacteroidales bacterium]|nr:hypothetical protein [Bacteroidales bacterium]
MQIKNIEGLTATDINRELERGGKFVIYQYCVSIVVLTFKRPSSIYFLRAGESGFSKSIIFTLISSLFGWWGIPWGPIYTIGSLVTNLGGGKNVTKEVIAALNTVPVTNQ